MTRMIIDCDPGLDDAIALVLAHHCAEVVGITTVSGNVPLAATTANALMLTAMLDVETPVHGGAAGPLAGEPTYAPHVHGSRAWATSNRRPTTAPQPATTRFPTCWTRRRRTRGWWRWGR